MLLQILHVFTFQFFYNFKYMNNNMYNKYTFLYDLNNKKNIDKNNHTRFVFNANLLDNVRFLLNTCFTLLILFTTLIA